jgi:hypothetical protein
MFFTPPSVTSPAELKFLVDLAIGQGLTQNELLQHWLRSSIAVPFAHADALYALRDALLVGLDVEWWEHDPKYVTELGVSILDPRFIDDCNSSWQVLRDMVTQHVRIKQNAHLVNADLCQGAPDKFEFGKTSFVDMEQAKEMLRCSFLRFDKHGKPRPIIFVGHAVQNDVKMIKERFGFDIDALGVVVATLDTQVLAIETGLAPAPRTLKLCDILSKFSVTEEYLHNAGNDIACTMVAATLMSSKYGVQNSAFAYSDLKRNRKPEGKIVYGSATYCTKCDSGNHLEANCQLWYYCRHCSVDGHSTEKCLSKLKEAVKARQKATPQWTAKPRLPIPCGGCIVSTDPARHNLDYAYGHLEKDCFFGGEGGGENAAAL